VGINGGASYCLGDINPGKHFIESDYTFGAYYRYNFSRRISFKMSANYAKFHSSDQISKEDLVRNAWFKSNIIDISLRGEINFLPFYIGAKREVITPYLTGGVSMAVPLKVEGGFLDDTYKFNEHGLITPTESLTNNSNVAPSLAIGFGVKVSLSKKLGMHAEWVMNKTFVDWLDGIYYYNNEAFFKRNNILYVCNTANSDWYSMIQIGISYKFETPEKKKCLEHIDNF
ncbi:DUF6089 family protein, partial [Bacteroidales bacterium OttesenSCG-928-K22]|nr:DUF6089 family protein [Bacteroidales bacterium OttesenSCG-928-K22]